jgi:DNA-directed RNA polymerase omega subunit
MVQKPNKLSSVEIVNIDKCVEAFGGNRFHLILAAAIRAKEISTQRLIAERAGDTRIYENKSSVTALREVADGKYGTDYLEKLNKRHKE